MKKAALLVLMLGLPVGAYFLWAQNETTLANTTPSSAAAKAKPPDTLGASAVLKIDPTTRLANPAPVRAGLPPPSAFMQAYLAGRDLAGLYRRLIEAPPTPETQYLQAEILSACNKRVPAAAPPGAPLNKAPNREERRTQFLASLAADDPNLELRKAAYEKMSVDRCGELAQMEYSEAEINRLLDVAAAGGDPRAKAWLLSRDLNRQIALDHQRPQDRRFSGVALSDAQFATMRELLASQDPLVIGEFRGVLSSSMRDGTIRIGPSQEIVDPSAFYNAWALVACDFGAPCDGDSITLLSACALAGRCRAGNVVDHTYFYSVSPYESQLVDRYRQWLTRMISSGDLSQLAFVRGGANPNITHMFGGNRRGP